MRFLYGNPIPNPCVRNCPERKAGCAITCEKWEEYRAKRDQYYKTRLVNSESKVHTQQALKKAKEKLRRDNTKRK